VKIVAQYRNAIEKALLSASEMGAPGPAARKSVGGKARSSVAAQYAPRRSVAVQFGGLPITAPEDGSSVFDSVPVKSGWMVIRRAMKTLLAPILQAWAAFLGSEGAAGRKIVLVVDEALVGAYTRPLFGST